MKTSKVLILQGIYDYRPLLKELNAQIKYFNEEEIFNEYFEHRISHLTYLDENFEVRNKELITLKKGVFDLLPEVFKKFLEDLVILQEEYLNS
ncbi:hypothetical protein ORI89_19025 [Sphingobacterium sp. UT-1RO-CII-1]|uniref:hypothetical protein n=1 Tax=Sphingobacterium sp. UT-1RO-CII-1 TaxID=2995225 RepID=UPI00227A50E1|nr:hypothetical protein [Sphingobacterium sp. UT-1RO-CII-1]MCY4781747.1 hypothetical protein [Sphingobacterium sp. UT-1RO-CII-1]